MPYGIGYPPDALAALGGQNAAYQDANPQGGMGEDNPLAALLALLQAPQDEPEQPDFPIPQEPNRYQIIGAIMQQALGNPQGAQMLQGMRQDRQGALQQQAALQQSGGLRQEGIRQRLMDSVLDAISAQNKETGLNERFDDKLAAATKLNEDRAAERERLLTERLTSAEKLAADREAGMNRRFDEGMGFKYADLAATNERHRLDLEQRGHVTALRKQALEAQIGRLNLPPAVGKEMVDFAASIQGAQDVLDFLTENGDVGGPGAAIGGIAFTADQDLLKAMLSDVTTLIGNLRSGAAITEAEFKRLSAILPAVNSRYRQKLAGMRQVKVFLERKFRGRQSVFKVPAGTVQELRDIVSGVPAIFEGDTADAPPEDEFEDAGEL